MKRSTIPGFRFPHARASRFLRLCCLLCLVCALGCDDFGSSSTPSDQDPEDGDTESSENETGDGDGEETDASDRDADSHEEEDEPALPLAALTACTPTTEPCAVAELASGIHASYRKDYYFPTSLYSEETEEPLNGGRFQIAGLSAVSGPVTGVFINDEAVEEMLVEPKLEWWHVWPDNAVAGEPLWVAFHSRDAAWDTALEGRIRVETENGTALDGTFSVSQTPLPITYVTTNASLDELLIHVRNTDTQAHVVSRLWVNGRDVTGAGIACLPDATIPAKQAVMWRVPQCAALKIGQAWTVVVEFEDLPPSVGAGRILRPFFPIEAWPRGSECPLPGVNDTVHGFFLEAGIDTLYHYWNGYQECGFDRDTMFFETLPARGDTYLLLGDDFPFHEPPDNALPVTDAILGFLTGDESDWAHYDENGVPNASKKAAKTRSVWHRFPHLLTYNGAMTNKHVGAFAGMADVQGIDIYAAACAPHITTFGDHPSLRAPYDYLRNTRNNHMPWTTWMYSQGVGSWTGHAAPQEILVQALSVMAAGGKGLMWFQAIHELALEQPEPWQAISDANRMFRAVRSELLQGDITDMAVSDPDTIVEMIRSPRALIVPVLNLKSIAEPTDEECLRYALGAAEQPHWILEDRLVAVSVDVPGDMALAEVFEVTPQGTAELAETLRASERRLTLENIHLSNDRPVRLFVFAADGELRQDIEEELR